MGGVLDFLKSAVQPAIAMRSGQLQGQREAEQDGQSLLARLQAQARQAKMDESKMAYEGAQSDEAKARAYSLMHPKPEGPVRGTPEYLAAVEGEDKIHAKYRPKPEASNVYLPSVDPTTGRTVYTVVPNRGPVKPENTGVVKPETGSGSGGAGGSQVPVQDMEERYNEIEGHAKDLAAGRWKIDPAMQTREGLTYGIARDNAHGNAPVGKQIGATVMDVVGAGKGKDFSRYQALMNSTRAMGDDVAKVFKGRQNEEAVLREVALAQLTPDDYNNPQVVEQKLSRLRHVIDLARATMPAAGAAPSAPSIGNHPAVQSIDDMIRAGKSDAEIKAALARPQ
jgi:hypothetical protein